MKLHILNLNYQEINKLCWNLSFNQKYYQKIIKDIKKNRDKLKLNKKTLL